VKRLIPSLATLALLVALNVFLPRVTNPYYFQVLILVGINIVLAVSLNLVNGFTGQFSIGHAGFMAVGAYTSAMFSLKVGPALLASLAMLPSPIAQGVVLLFALVAGGLLAAVAGTSSACRACGCAGTISPSSRSASARSSAC
jgi:branched-chain amino acid transport system permease protein